MAEIGANVGGAGALAAPAPRFVAVKGRASKELTALMDTLNALPGDRLAPVAAATQGKEFATEAAATEALKNALRKGVGNITGPDAAAISAKIKAMPAAVAPEEAERRKKEEEDLKNEGVKLANLLKALHDDDGEKAREYAQGLLADAKDAPPTLEELAELLAKAAWEGKWAQLKGLPPLALSGKEGVTALRTHVKAPGAAAAGQAAAREAAAAAAAALEAKSKAARGAASGLPSEQIEMVLKEVRKVRTSVFDVFPDVDFKVLLGVLERDPTLSAVASRVRAGAVGDGDQAFTEVDSFYLDLVQKGPPFDQDAFVRAAQRRWRDYCMEAMKAGAPLDVEALAAEEEAQHLRHLQRARLLAQAAGGGGGHPPHSRRAGAWGPTRRRSAARKRRSASTAASSRLGGGHKRRGGGGAPPPGGGRAGTRRMPPCWRRSWSRCTRQWPRRRRRPWRTLWWQWA